MKRHKKNPYVGDARSKQARERGYPARSVFKLEEIDRRLHLLRRGMTVLDLGCAPGSWALYAARRVGRDGLVLGIDLQACELDARPPLIVVQGDATELGEDGLRAHTAGRCPPFDVALSDMAPRTTGVRAADHAASMELCDTALALALDTLRPGGAFVAKAFEGPDLQDLERRVREGFGKVRRIKPRGTRARSVEIFLVGTERRG